MRGVATAFYESGAQGASPYRWSHAAPLPGEIVSLRRSSRKELLIFSPRVASSVAMIRHTL